MVEIDVDLDLLPELDEEQKFHLKHTGEALLLTFLSLAMGYVLGVHSFMDAALGTAPLWTLILGIVYGIGVTVLLGIHAQRGRTLSESVHNH